MTWWFSLNDFPSCWCSDTFPNCLILSVSWALTSLRFCLAAEPLSRLLSDRPEGPTLEEPVQDAGTLWQIRVWLLPTLLHSPTGYQAAKEGLGGWSQQAEMDRQTGMVYITKVVLKLLSDILVIDVLPFLALSLHLLVEMAFRSFTSGAKCHARDRSSCRSKLEDLGSYVIPNWDLLSNVVYISAGIFTSPTSSVGISLIYASMCMWPLMTHSVFTSLMMD